MADSAERNVDIEDKNKQCIVVGVVLYSNQYDAKDVQQHNSYYIFSGGERTFCPEQIERINFCFSHGLTCN